MRSNLDLIAHLFDAGYADARIAEAMRKVDRAQFVPASLTPNAYIDSPLPIGHGQTISAPGVVALMSKLLDVKAGMTVLEIGSGSGYQAAILAELVGKRGKIITIERIEWLSAAAKSNCERAGYKNIEFIHGDGSKGYAKNAPYSRIIVTAAAREVPKALTAQLAEGGKLVIPVGQPYRQDLLVIDKLAGGVLKTERSIPVVFVPLIEGY
ncbi:Protein-L-isoaspartate O-methyltransferase [Candidatus Burarchaeum australiense]|nr:Protein-L-isoaspartate O-methyltransferase [Candidatus Burarchaeum australiense]